MDQEINKALYLVALGSNLGEREQLLASALKLLAASAAPAIAVAPLYETAAIGAADQPFLNSAAIIETQHAPASLLQVALTIEHQLGRQRQERWGNRPIDIDLLLWRPTVSLLTAVFDAATLHIPHPEMLRRDFVLVPAARIAGDWIHPVSQKSLAAECQLRGFQLPIEIQFR